MQGFCEPPLDHLRKRANAMRTRFANASVREYTPNLPPLVRWRRYGRAEQTSTETCAPGAGGGEAAHDYRYGVLVAEALRTPGAFGPSGEGLVDAEVIPDFSGRPEQMSAWLIFATRERAQAAKATARRAALEARARELLVAAGFPDDALASFRLDVTSEPEIEEGGGRFSFFR